MLINRSIKIKKNQHFSYYIVLNISVWLDVNKCSTKKKNTLSGNTFNGLLLPTRPHLLKFPSHPINVIKLWIYQCLNPFMMSETSWSNYLPKGPQLNADRLETELSTREILGNNQDQTLRALHKIGYLYILWLWNPTFRYIPFHPCMQGVVCKDIHCYSESNVKDISVGKRKHTAIHSYSVDQDHSPSTM
jgi:hypothetical protein